MNQPSVIPRKNRLSDTEGAGFTPDRNGRRHCDPRHPHVGGCESDYAWQVDPNPGKAGTDLLSGMIEQARTAAITTRSDVVLAIAEPGDLPAGDERCHLGLFKIKAEDWPSDPATGSVNGELMSRWQNLETGIALIGGEVDGVANLLDSPKLTVSYGANKPMSVKMHAIAFNSHGGLLYPARLHTGIRARGGRKLPWRKRPAHISMVMPEPSLKTA